MSTALTPGVLALWVCAATCFPAATAYASCDGSHTRSGIVTLEVGSDQRLFVLRVPSAADGRTPSPVVFAFHPFGMNAQYMQSRVPGRFWAEAIVLYPEGLSRAGGGIGPSWQGRPGELGDRDLRFFDAMLAWLTANECVDEARVFVMGYSNGAALANLIACERAPAVAGAAMAAGRLACQPETARPAIISHGTRDGTVGYEQAIAASRAWAKVNGCAAPPRPGTLGCVAAESCTSAPVTLCTHGGGHEYSSSFTRSLMEFFQKAGAGP